MKKTIVWKNLSLAILLAFLVCPAAFGAPAHTWTPVGPDGGDARSFAADPRNPAHIYLGTTDGWVYDSTDSGKSWQRLAKLSTSEDLIIDNIVVDKADPRTLWVAAWVLDRRDGGLFVSHDAGKTWTANEGMKGQSIRALAQAPSNPKILVAGTLDGVYRSEDGGQAWKLVSPLGSLEIHEVESIAIDPRNPAIIYAGTWHLPWKTENGGTTWHSIKEGLITDSDVFSIIIDPVQPEVVYTSACSGIYKSENGGALYHKIQGIPSSARRTRVLMQDPVNRAVVYAGTTEGLYKTVDSGVKWRRMTDPDVIVNDVYVDPKNPNRVLLATDRSGVLASTDAGISFVASNRGFSQRQVASLLIDPVQPQTIYAGVLNDKGYGGVFVSRDGGSSWQQRSNGLGGRDVFSLASAGEGSLLAGTNAGLFRWSGSAWQADGKIVNPEKKISYIIRKRKKVRVEKTVMVPAGEISGRINAIVTGADTWLTASSSGVYVSHDRGATWEGGPVIGRRDFTFAAMSGATLVAGHGSNVVISDNGGKDWRAVALPSAAHWVRAATFAGDGSLWIGGRNGVFYSRDSGRSWNRLSKLPMAQINGVTFDPELKRVMLTSASSPLVMAVDPGNETWDWWNPGWKVHTIRSLGGRLLGASFFNGVVAGPGIMTSAAAAAHPAGS